ncbi:hypothetical protein A2Z10_03650 [Candidatus Azambacteria bacterium RBG_16_47_10]|uniref:Uncharacterized protein n=1 Tax=Candidatus Azambacteria bacterium RBG_16_47_10 TaxID=1797292 RepID=A0A1F5B035_9BACT|nr:MAG: hypothetical protein A2Z10_03650 [Candidatus Azambacteria bacterium RBG_16_47_10]
MAKKKAGSSMSVAAVGAGLAAVAAAAAGTYFLYGSKKASKHRKEVKAWSLKARGEILEQLERLSHVDEKAYHKVIKEVAGKYKALQGISAKDIGEFAGELKDHWKDIAKDIAKSTPVVKKIRPLKKAAKKRK